MGAGCRAGGSGGVYVYRGGWIGHRANGTPLVITSIVSVSVGRVIGAVSWDLKQCAGLMHRPGR